MAERDDKAEGAREGRAKGAPAGDERDSTVVRGTTKLPEAARTTPLSRRRAAREQRRNQGPRQRQHRLSAPARRDLALAIAAACIVAIIVGTFALVELGNAPTADQVQADAHDALSNPQYGGGMYGSDDPLDLESVRILEIKRTRGGADPAATVSVQAQLTNGSIDALCQADLHYERLNGGWLMIGKPTGVTYAYTATKGIDQDKLQISIDEVLSKAEASLEKAGDDGSASDLPTLYQGAEIKVASESFDKKAQTDELSIQLTQRGSYSQHVATIDATFKFMAASGLWELSEATAEKGAKDIDLSPLLGAWTGTFMSQETSGAKCLAAANHKLSLRITDVDGKKISGTISGVAHFHASPAQDQDVTEGDQDLAGLAFTGTLTDDSKDGSPSFDCHVADAAGGTLALQLSFSTGDSGDGATAKLTSTYSDTSSLLLFIPITTTASFADTYQLARSAS